MIALQADGRLQFGPCRRQIAQMSMRQPQGMVTGGIVGVNLRVADKMRERFTPISAL